MNTQIDNLVQKALAEKPVYKTINIDLTFQEGLAHILKLLIPRSYSIDIVYFSSQGSQLVDANDLLFCSENSELERIEFRHKDENHNVDNRTLRISLEQYIARLKFPQSISFLEISYDPRDSKIPKGEIMVNRFLKAVSMERRYFGEGSYLTTTRFSQHLLIASRPE